MAKVQNIGNSSMFEKVMAACLESKRVPATNSKTTRKIVKESKLSKKNLTEDEDLIDPVDDVDEIDDTMDDIADDIVVVVDPEVSEDDIDAAGAEAQDIIDSTPDGEIPMTDEYVGDYTYTCPICGNTFFSEIEMNDGDECPVCGDFPNGYVLVGAVESPEEATAEDDEGLDDDIADIGDEVADDAEDLEPSIDDESIRPTSRRVEKRARRTLSKYMLDESTFNPFMNKFIRENYRNAKSFEIKGATISGKTLTLECKLQFKSGKSRDVKLSMRNFNKIIESKKMSVPTTEDGTFKVESKKGVVAPFIFDVSVNKNVIRCEGMKYNLITKAVKENKTVQISGKLVKESRKPTSKRTSK